MKKPVVSADKATIKRQARREIDAVEAAFVAGDYAMVLRLCRRASAPLKSGGGADPKAAQGVFDLKTDPVALFAGLGTLALYGLAWIFALNR